jgi:hypothetical protein
VPKPRKPSKTQLRWEETYAPALASWRGLFSFLVDEHGFAARESVVPAECTLTFTRDEDDLSVTSVTSVAIAQEYAEPPWITVRVGDAAYALSIALDELAPRRAAELARAQEANDGAAVVSAYATFFAAHAKTLLSPATAVRVAAVQRARRG